MNKLLLPAAYLSFSAIPLLAQAQASEPSGAAGKISHDIWWGMGNSPELESLWGQDAFYQQAHSSVLLDSFEVPQHVANMFGQRLRGYLIAPVTGEYNFWASGDDSYSVWLSDGENKFNKQEIIAVKGAVAFRQWGKAEYLRSAPILLEAGKRYYIEAQGKDAEGGDHLSVAWSYSEGGGLVNWALESGVLATQSSTAWGGEASRAIDGNTDGRFSNKSITHTYRNPGEWWQVDLGVERQIDRVELYNRNRDGSLIRRLSNFRVSVINAAGEVAVSKDFYATGGHVQGVEYWETGGVQGSVVKVEMLGPGASGERYLALAEVKVLGRTDAEAQSYQGLEVIPGNALESFAGSLNDADDDSYPDDWEGLHGFDATAYQLNDTMYGPLVDADKDGLINLEESYLNIDPFKGDSMNEFWTVEKWANIVEYEVSNLIKTDRFFQQADSRELTDTNSFVDLESYSAARLRGYITAPETGTYRFWISSTGGSELWLSTDETKYRKQFLAGMGPKFGTGHGIASHLSNLWDLFSSQVSEEVHLVAGQKYYCEMLTQQGHPSNRHVSIAWARPGKEREALPMEFVSSYAFTEADADDDYLPDAWESQYGLNPADNGGVDREREGENGDFDLDGLSNRLEYVYGTNPANPDYDGDGVLDGDEIHSYGTDPSTSDAPSEALLGSVDLASFTSADATWTSSSGGLISSTFRGGIEWDFNVPSDGYYVLHLRTKLLGELYLHETVPANVSIDGAQVWKSNIVYGQQREALVRVTTPYLTAGSHSTKLFIDNIIARRSVSIQSLQVFQPNGVDNDGDGKPDWIESQLAGLNTLYPYQATSRTSPAFLEGRARSRSVAQFNNQSVLTGLDDNHWYANLPLNLTDQTLFNVSFESGITESGQVQWQTTDVLQNETLTIRRGDALKLTANGADVNAGGSFELSLDTTWSSGYLPTLESEAVFVAGGIDLETIGNVSGLMLGFMHPSATVSTSHHLVATTDSVTFQLQNFLGDYTKSVKIKLALVGDKVVAHQIYARYKAGNHLGLDFDTLTGVSAAPVGSNGYGVSSLSFSVSLTDLNGLANGEALAVTFAGAGTQVVKATHSDGSTGQLTVNVKQADFSEESTDFLSNSVRNAVFSLSDVDGDLFFEAGDAANLLSVSSDANTLTIQLAPQGSGENQLAARLYDGGPILDTQTFNLIQVSDALQNDLTSTSFSQEFRGYYKFKAPLVATGLPVGGKVKVTIFRAGVTFPDGTKVKWVEVSDFVNDTVVLEFLFPVGMTGGYCHYLDIYDRNGAYVGRR